LSVCVQMICTESELALYQMKCTETELAFVFAKSAMYHYRATSQKSFIFNVFFYILPYQFILLLRAVRVILRVCRSCTYLIGSPLFERLAMDRWTSPIFFSIKFGFQELGGSARSLVVICRIGQYRSLCMYLLYSVYNIVVIYCSYTINCSRSVLLSVRSTPEGVTYDDYRRFSTPIPTCPSDSASCVVLF
jgi:hypothetical protein